MLLARAQGEQEAQILVIDFMHLKAGRTAAILRADRAARFYSGTATKAARSSPRSPLAGGCGHNFFFSPSSDARRSCAGLSISASAMGCDRVWGDGGFGADLPSDG